MQHDLWHDTILDAVGAAVQAAGGMKKVAGKLWPTLDSTSATARLRACLNPDHAQKLDPEEFVMIGKLARDANDVSIVQFLERGWDFEAKMISREDAKKTENRRRRLALLEELKRLEDE